jgi:hypothetical protein
VENLKEKPFALLGVNTIGKDPKKLKAVVEKEHLNWRSIANTDAINLHWNYPGTPAYYILDKQGVIRHKWVGNPGARTIEAALEKLIDGPLDK